MIELFIIFDKKKNYWNVFYFLIFNLFVLLFFVDVFLVMRFFFNFLIVYDIKDVLLVFKVVSVFSLCELKV